MKNIELVRNFSTGAVCIVVAAMLLLAVESKGQIIESRAGIFGLVVIVALLAIAAISAQKAESQKPDKPSSSAKKRS